MKSLTYYTEKENSKALDNANAFWAFSQSQFNESKKEGLIYVSCGGGLYCEKGKSKQLFKSLNENTKKGIEQDLKENGKEKIIIRELYNYESFYTGDITDAIEGLEGYNFTHEEIKNIYSKELPKANL